MGSPAKSQTFALDEELWFGDHDDAEAESRAAASLAAVGARIVGAKPFPVAARRLDELTRNPSTRIEQVVNVLESDPALSARLLRLVNSAGYGLKVRVTSVRHAAVLVGTRRLNQVATTAAILDLFDGNNEHGIELLEHAAVVGSLCRYLAVHQGLPHDELFTCGFLHDIGKLMLLDAERERYAELLNEFGHAPDQIHLAERKVFGFDHAVLGAHVLTAWNIPEPVPRVIAWHHAPARAMQDTVVSAMVQTLRLADLLAYVLALPDEQQAIELAAASEAANYLEVSDVQLSAMWSDLTALRDRSRARSHGEPELDAMLPKRDVSSLRARASLSPSQKPAKSVGRPLHEVPSHFPCSVCAKPSFGNVCAACGGHVCPSHQVGADEWCSVCAREFVRFKKSAELSGGLRAGIGVLVGGTLSIALYSASRAPDAGVETLILAPVMVLALWAVVLPVAYRLWQKLAFLERRRKKGRFESMAVARSRTTPTPALAKEAAPAPAAPASSATPKPVSEYDSADHDAPLSMAPLSTAPLSVPPVLSSAPHPASSRSHVAPRATSLHPAPTSARAPAHASSLHPALEPVHSREPISSVHPASESVAPRMSMPEVTVEEAKSLLPESLLPDADLVSVRPTSVSVVLAAHFGKNSQRPASPSRGAEPAPSAMPRPLALVSERPQLTLPESMHDALPRPAAPILIQEAPAPSVAPPTVASVAPPTVASVAPTPVTSAAPAPVTSVAPAPVASVAPAPVASVPPAPATSVAPVASMAPVASALPPAALSPTPVASISPAASVAPAAAAPVASVVPAAVPSAAPVAPSVAPAAAQLAASLAPTQLAVPPEIAAAAAAAAEALAARSSLPAPHISIGPDATLSFAPEASIPPMASQAPSEEAPDSGAQLVVPPPAPRVYNSPLARGAAISCVRVQLQACVGASGPNISHRPLPEMATPGSRESA